jgi:hypothetical protein
LRILSAGVVRLGLGATAIALCFEACDFAKERVLVAERDSADGSGPVAVAGREKTGAAGYGTMSRLVSPGTKYARNCEFLPCGFLAQHDNARPL